MFMLRLSLFIFIVCFSFCNAVFAAGQEYVVVLHGIARSSDHMKDVEIELLRNRFQVINVDYSSTDLPLDKLVDEVQLIINEQLPDEHEQVHFVGYSMGGVVARGVVAKYRPERLGRVVMLGTPNQGSEVADTFADSWLYKSVYGPAGQELTTDNADVLHAKFGAVNYPLGIVAGNGSVDPVSSVLIPGDDDGKVSIESTRIKGMTDHIVVGASHPFLPQNVDALKQMVYFLRYGEFNRFGWGEEEAQWENGVESE